MEYRLCGWQISCDDFGTVNNSSDTNCTSGCFCSDGVILRDGVCIDPDICPSKQLCILHCNEIIKYKCTSIMITPHAGMLHSPDCHGSYIATYVCMHKK